MDYLIALGSAVLIIFGILTAPAPAHHIKAGIPVKAIVGGSSLTGGAAVVGTGIEIVGAAVIWCGLNQPKRNLRRDTFVDGRHDVYPTYNSRKTGCIFKDPKKPNVVSVRG